MALGREPTGRPVALAVARHQLGLADLPTLSQPQPLTASHSYPPDAACTYTPQQMPYNRSHYALSNAPNTRECTHSCTLFLTHAHNTHTYDIYIYMPGTHFSINPQGKDKQLGCL